MKKIIVFVFYILILYAFSSCHKDTKMEQTLNEIIENFKQSIGGTEIIDSLNSIHFELEFPDHEYIVSIDVKRPDKMRITGGDEYVLLFNGKKAAYLKGAKSENGEDPGSQFVPESEWKDFELDKAWYLPAFLYYPSTYIGLDSVDTFQVYKLQTLLPLGAKMIYYIDTQSYSIRKISAEVEINGKTYFPHRRFFDFRRVNGLMMPSSFSYSYSEDEGNIAQILNFEVNKKYSNEFFEIPFEIPMDIK